jgi:2'-5' RNA ligase superfamily
MREYLPFINDPAHLARLKGHRYVILRPNDIVSATHATVQSSIRTNFSDLAISYPARAHVTLTGFPPGTPLEAVQGLIHFWAAGVPSLLLEVEGISVFPAPFQIVIVQIHKAAALFHALSSLRTLAKRQGLPDWPAGTLPSVDDWIFHMSVAYCATLSDTDWATMTSFSESLTVPSVSCVAYEAELVAFDDGQEYCGGIFPLSGDSGLLRAGE